MDTPKSFGGVIVLFNEAFKCGHEATNAEPVCVEFCNFVRYSILATI
jgi:hypothetical protein